MASNWYIQKGLDELRAGCRQRYGFQLVAIYMQPRPRLPGAGLQRRKAYNKGTEASFILKKNIGPQVPNLRADISIDGPGRLRQFINGPDLLLPRCPRRDFFG